MSDGKVQFGVGSIFSPELGEAEVRLQIGGAPPIKITPKAAVLLGNILIATAHQAEADREIFKYLTSEPVGMSSDDAMDLVNNIERDMLQP